jgi:ABC-type molybdate transport system substrate-binding protein
LSAPEETTPGRKAPAPTPHRAADEPLSGELSIFFAASLDQVLAEMKTAFEQTHPGVQVRAEASGSQVAARKVSEYGRKADLVLTADWRVIDELLRPAHATWNIGFASNEIVLAYSESSRHAAEINGDNWPGMLLRNDVRVARVNEDLVPIGYQTLLVWKLAERHYAQRLAGRGRSDRDRARYRDRDRSRGVAAYLGSFPPGGPVPHPGQRRNGPGPGHRPVHRGRPRRLRQRP